LIATNYIDVRNEHHRTDQATVRFDQNFHRGDSIFARYSFSSEKGFMPQNLPGFGAIHDNLSQNGTVGWNRIISPNVVNMANITVRAYRCIALPRTASQTISSLNSVLQESVLAAQAHSVHPGSTYRATRAWATPISLHQCTPGIRFWKHATH